MPKIKKFEPEEDEDEEQEEDYEGMDEDDLEEEEQEELEKIEKIIPKKTHIKNKKIIKKQKPAPAQRYVPFAISERVGIMDSETQEVLAEGSLAILQTLADVVTRLERIENLIGNLAGE